MSTNIMENQDGFSALASTDRVAGQLYTDPEIFEAEIREDLL